MLYLNLTTLSLNLIVMHISITPEVLFHIGSLPVTNTLLTAWLVVILITVGAIIFSFTFKHYSLSFLFCYHDYR